MISDHPILVPLALSSLSLHPSLTWRSTNAQVFTIENGEGCGALQVRQDDGYILVSLTDDDRRSGAEGSCIFSSGERRGLYQLYPREFYLDADLAAQALAEYTRWGRHRIEREIGWRLFGSAYIRSLGTIDPGVHVIHLSTGERGLLFDSLCASKEHVPWGGTYHFGFYYFPFPAYRKYLEESHPHWTARIAKIEAIDACFAPQGPRQDLTSGFRPQRVTLPEKSQVGSDLFQPQAVVSCFGEASSVSKDWQLQGPWQAAEIEALEGAFRQLISWHPGLNFLEARKKENMYRSISGAQCRSTWYDVVAHLPYRILCIYAQSLDELIRRMLPVFLHQDCEALLHRT